MIQYLKCTEVDIPMIYKGFSDGFSDYMIEFDMTEEGFVSAFFGPEGNDGKYSFIALDEGEPVGVILGGLKMFDGLKTLRCGTLAVSPGYRGYGIAQELFELHKSVALSEDCRQLFLEVIVGNDRAIRFYQRLGYEKIYDLWFFTHDDLTVFKKYDTEGLTMKKIEFEVFEKAWLAFNNCHINWQNDLDYVKKSSDITCMGGYMDGKLVSLLCYNDSGRVKLIFVDENYRCRGIASSMINRICEDREFEKLRISFTNNSGLYGFVRKMGFSKDSVAEYEMYLPL